MTRRRARREIRNRVRSESGKAGFGSASRLVRALVLAGAGAGALFAGECRAQSVPGAGVAEPDSALERAASDSLGGKPTFELRTSGVPSNPDSTLAAAIDAIPGEPLALNQAVRDAILQSTIALGAEANERAAQGAVRREKGAFDPELYGNLLRESVDSPTSSPFAGADVLETEATIANAGARMRLQTGTELAVTLETMKGETNSAFAALDPQYDAATRLSLRQPLLKGFGPAARSDLSAAERDLEAASARREAALLVARAEAEKAYWDLYAAERDVAVRRLIRDQAEALVRETQLRAQGGLVGPSAVANAKVFLAEQEQSLIDGEEALDRVSDALASLIGRRPSGDLVRFRPVDDPPEVFEVEQQDSLVARALRVNRVLLAAERTVDSFREHARGARWDALPALDLVGSVGGQGLAGEPREVIFGSDTLRTSIDGSYGDAVGDAAGNDFPAWSAGLELSFPIGLREGRGERERLEAEADRAEQELITLQRIVADGIRGSHRELTNSSRRLSSAREGVQASFEQLRIGLLEFRTGRTTAFELVRLGADLARAQERYSQALVRTAKAQAEILRLTSEEVPL